MDEYVEYKNQIKALMGNLEQLEKETKSYAELNTTLTDLSSRLYATSRAMAEIIRKSEEIYDHVNDVSVRSTLESFRISSESFADEAQALTKAVSENGSKTIDHLNDITRSMTTLYSKINTKVLILGGVSVVGSLTALVLAVVL